MKYEYTVTRNSAMDDYYSNTKPEYDFSIKTDDYLLYMSIITSSIHPDWNGIDRARNVSRCFLHKFKELEFTGSWRIRTDDSDKEKTIIFDEVKHEYVLQRTRRTTNKIKQTGFMRLFRRYTEEDTYEELPDEVVDVKIWLHEDEFEFRSLFQNECASCNE